MRSIIKTGQYVFGLPEGLPLSDHPIADRSAILREAYEEAKSIVDAAQAFSDQHIKETTARMAAESVQARQNAYDEGYAKGTEEGLRDGYRDGNQDGYQEGLRRTELANQELYDSYLTLIASLEQKQQEILEKHRKELTDLSLLIAKSIIKKELAENDETLPRLVESVLEQYREMEWVRVYVSPGMLERLNRDPELLKKYQTASKEIKWMAGSDLEETDCIIELPTEVIDVSVDSQLEKIRSVIKY